ncbi:ABC transporter permease [Globicatella sulfidifaciens]
MFLALKEIKKEKKRFILIISITVLISYLVYFLMGLAYGLSQDNTSEIERWNAESIVLKSGVNNNILSSQLDKDIYYDYDDQEISAINIARTVGYLNGEKSDDTTENFVLIGMRQDSPIYPEVLDGRLPENSGEIIGSMSLKNELNLKLGDTIELSSNENKLKIVGFSQEAKYSVSPVIYTDLEIASQAMMLFNPNRNSEQAIDTYTTPTPNMPDLISAIIVHQNNDLKSNDDVEVIPVDEFILALPGYLAQVLTFGLMIGFLVLISSIILGVFMYIITNQKRQTFAIMKIQGISSSYIGKSVLLQTVILNIIGISIGLGLNLISAYFLPTAVPFEINGLYYFIIALLMLLFSIVGALFSVSSIAKIDPLEVLE